eukprot:gnl/MRDRNA2_/MRDRNA2_94896_c0_seq1.p1 gnl/MRDRNA2_/MRDRNA2_94896_c0~~gnl/MRDRNA2_/MRDRNA2_94896_c0_seq1.p1  ORF type:complete len:841 (-),score=161.04 gnl/MRDRNA2_/MRDRNA2_94896_c0_seq1:76-2598(-)
MKPVPTVMLAWSTWTLAQAVYASSDGVFCVSCQSRDLEKKLHVLADKHNIGPLGIALLEHYARSSMEANSKGSEVLNSLLFEASPTAGEEGSSNENEPLEEKEQAKLTNSSSTSNSHPNSHSKPLAEEEDDEDQHGLTHQDRLALRAQVEGSWEEAHKDKRCGQCFSFQICEYHTITHHVNCNLPQAIKLCTCVGFLLLLALTSIYVWKPVLSIHLCNLDGVKGTIEICMYGEGEEREYKVQLKALRDQRCQIAQVIHALDARIKGSVDAGIVPPNANARDGGTIADNEKFEEDVPESDGTDVDPESAIQARAKVVASTLMPYLMFAKSVNERANQLQDNVVQKSKDLIHEETQKVIFDSVGLPNVFATSSKHDLQLDASSVLLSTASVIAPFQLSMLWLSCVVGMWLRIIYCIVATCILIPERNAMCRGNISDVGSLGIKNWLHVDLAMQILHIALVLPVIRLARQATQEIQRPETAYTDPNDPVACLKDVLLEDSTYASFAIFRYDQICALPALDLMRYLKYIDFTWLFLGLSLVFENPVVFCGATGTLYIARGRICVFLLMAGFAMVEVLLTTFQLLLSHSDSLFYWFMRSCEQFDHQYGPGGLPVAASLARTFVTRDCSDMQKVQKRMVKRERGLTREEIRRCKEEQKHMRSEMKHIDKNMLEKERHLKVYLERERKLEAKFGEDLVRNIHTLEEQGIVLAHEAEARLEQTELGHKALEAGKQMEEETMAYYKDPEALQKLGQDLSSTTLQASQTLASSVQQASTQAQEALYQAEQVTESAIAGSQSQATGHLQSIAQKIEHAQRMTGRQEDIGDASAETDGQASAASAEQTRGEE